MKLAGKVSLITGAASGIGEAQALLFGKEGAKVIIADINFDGANKVANQIGSSGGQAMAVEVDMSNSDSIKQAMHECTRAYGTVDILCNTAGIFDEFVQSLNIDDGFWDKCFATNITGMQLITKEVLPGMLEKGKGIIINMASICGLGASGGIAYVSTKHAVVGFTKQLCLDYAPKGIRTNAIAPGPVVTPLTGFLNDPDMALEKLSGIPCGRFGKPEDVARVSLFLASDDADFIHGTVITVDGGRTARV